MPRLQRRILPVIREAQQARGLAGLAHTKLWEACHGRCGYHGGGGRAAGLAESHQLAKVALAQIIGGAAAKAQHEVPRLPPGRQRTSDFSLARFAVSGYPNAPRDVGLIMRFDARTAFSHLDKVVGQVLALAPEAAVLKRDEAGVARQVLVSDVQQWRAWQEFGAILSGRK